MNRATFERAKELDMTIHVLDDMIRRNENCDNSPFGEKIAILVWAKEKKQKCEREFAAL